MAFLSLNKSFIAAGETFRLTFVDYDGSLNDIVSYSISGDNVTAAHFDGETSLSGNVTLGGNKTGFKDFSTTEDLPTSEDFTTLTFSSAGYNDITLKVYSAGHYKSPENKIQLGDTFDTWRKKTNGVLARLDALEEGSLEFKTHTFFGDGSSTEFDLKFVPLSADTLLFTVNIDGVTQNPLDAYTIDTDNAKIVFPEAPPENSSVSVIHKYEIGSIAYTTLTEDLSVTPQKLSTGGPVWDTDGDLKVGGSLVLCDEIGEEHGITINNLDQILLDGIPLNFKASAFLLDQYHGASAAYSLRTLSSDWSDKPVVEVRRNSDDSTAQFKADDIGYGAGAVLTDWVNATVALPLDTSNSASAAFSLRDLTIARTPIAANNDSGDNPTESGDWVVQVRREIDGALKSFTAAQVSDGTLTNWVGTGATDHGYVATWYDQSGNANHATQPVTQNQPKIVDAGNLVTYNGQTCISNHAANSGIQLEIPISLRNSTLDMFATYGADTTETRGTLLSQDNSATGYLGILELNGISTVIDELTTGSYRKDGTDFTGSTRGDMYTTYHTNALTLVNINGTAGDYANWEANLIPFAYYTGTTHSPKCYYSELIIYNSDQTDNRKAIESNMADYHGNIDLPAGFDSGNDEVVGFVTTWYDQSGNKNDVHQTIATKQPRIVKNGSIIVDDISGYPEIEFDGLDDGFNYSEAIRTIKMGSSFVLARNNSLSGTQTAISLSNSPNWHMPHLSDGSWSFEYGSNSIDIGVADIETRLFSASASRYSTEVFLDGLSKGSVDSESGLGLFNESDVNIAGNSSNNFWNGTLQEIIIYDIDKRLERKGIELNINTAYNLDL